MKRARHELWRSAEVSRLVALLSGEREYLASILDAVPIAVAVLGENLTIEAANAAFWRVFNQPANAGVGRPVGEIAGDARDALRVWNALEQGEPTVRLGGTDFLVSRLHEGEEIVLAARVAAATEPLPKPDETRVADTPGKPSDSPAPAEAEPAPSRISGACEQFADRMRAVSRLAGGLSHELNNMLTIITSYCHLVTEELQAAKLPTESADAILKAANDAARLGAQLVALGGRHVTQETPTDLNLLLSAVADALQNGAHPAQISFSPADSLPPVLADARQLERAFTALFRHADEVTHQPGTITVRTEANAEAESVRVTVSDSRVWPDAAAGLAMFEPYAAYPGTKKSAGLELTVAWAILRQCRAEVEVATPDRCRTTITITLPTSECVRTADTAPARETVLLVDDNSEIRNAIRHMLQRQGYDVMEVAQPEEALRLCEHHPGIRILLSDFNMPSMTGRELAERAKRLRPELRVIIMSGYADEELDMSSLGESELVFLQKPFTPDRLLRMVRGMFGRS